MLHKAGSHYRQRGQLWRHLVFQVLCYHEKQLEDMWPENIICEEFSAM